MLKVELHAHTALDPVDYITHSTRQLIDRAAALGYGALAITLHNRHYDPADDEDYARRRGLVLLRGIERTIAGRHILLVNFGPASGDVATFDDLRRLKAREPSGLVVMPHGFYPTPTAMSADADSCVDIVDAVEVNSMFTSWLNFNQRAVEWARRHGKPVVGNTDLHLLDQLGTTFSLVDADPEPDAICAAIRAGRVELRATALPTMRAAWIMARMLGGGAAGRFRDLLPSRR